MCDSSKGGKYTKKENLKALIRVDFLAFLIEILLIYQELNNKAKNS